MSPRRSQAELIRDELREYIAGPNYLPGPFTGVAEEDWPACFPKEREDAEQPDAEDTVKRVWETKKSPLVLAINTAAQVILMGNWTHIGPTPSRDFRPSLCLDLASLMVLQLGSQARVQLRIRCKLQLLARRFATSPASVPAAVHWTEDPRAGTELSPVPMTKNQHWSVAPDGTRRVNFTSRTYSALKALTGYNTHFIEKGVAWERDALLRVSSSVHENCLSLNDSFTVLGKGSAGSHLCLVTPLLAGSVMSIWKEGIPLPITKRILHHTLRGLAHAHKCGVVHTDLKPANIFVNHVMSTADIDVLLVADPSRAHETQASYDGIVFSAVSQPLPGPSMDTGMQCTYVLGDFGSAQPIGQRLYDDITPVSLRPPEVWLEAPWDEKVDIWTFGCLVYEFVMSRRLFVPEATTWEGVALDDAEAIFHQMLCFTMDDFPAELLQASRNAHEWFTTDCKLIKEPNLYSAPFELLIKLRLSKFKLKESLSESEIESLARLLKRCLRIAPGDRCSAEELLSDPWFDQE
ncbi:kinase-like domain-containing protein [Mycena filopes]|nr:kinase-like domain-containing protein [Mycena filopes]